MKEYTWNIKIGEAQHVVIARSGKLGMGFTLYDGDKLIAKIPSQKMFKVGIEHDFEIDGEALKFVCLNADKPDILRDGVMVNKNITYAEAVRKYCVGEVLHWGIIMAALVFVLVLAVCAAPLYGFGGVKGLVGVILAVFAISTCGYMLIISIIGLIRKRI